MRVLVLFPHPPTSTLPNKQKWINYGKRNAPKYEKSGARLTTRALGPPESSIQHGVERQMQVPWFAWPLLGDHFELEKIDKLRTPNCKTVTKFKKGKIRCYCGCVCVWHVGCCFAFFYWIRQLLFLHKQKITHEYNDCNEYHDNNMDNRECRQKIFTTVDVTHTFLWWYHPPRELVLHCGFLFVPMIQKFSRNKYIWTIINLDEKRPLSSFCLIYDVRVPGGDWKGTFFVWKIWHDHFLPPHILKIDIFCRFFALKDLSDFGTQRNFFGALQQKNNQKLPTFITKQPNVYATKIGSSELCSLKKLLPYNLELGTTRTIAKKRGYKENVIIFQLGKLSLENLKNHWKIRGDPSGRTAPLNKFLKGNLHVFPHVNYSRTGPLANFPGGAMPRMDARLNQCRKIFEIKHWICSLNMQQEAAEQRVTWGHKVCPQRTWTRRTRRHPAGRLPSAHWCPKRGNHGSYTPGKLASPIFENYIKRTQRP